MATVVLLRHAKAEPEGDLGDRLRPLAARGRSQSTALGKDLRGAVGEVDLALVSAALRTTETFKLLAQGLPVARHEVRDDLYEAGPRTVLEILRRVPAGTGTVLVVGHEPTMSGLAHLLHDTADDLGREVSLGIPTASACLLDVPVPWAELDRDAAHLTGVLRPAE